MPHRATNVVSLAAARALRDTLRDLHTPEFNAIIYDGAVGEFTRLIAPALRDLLAAKGTPETIQRELIHLLAKVYAVHHVDATQTKSLADGMAKLIAESERR